jgi:lipopolysaccharide/colanic/teichoic acid biosynthesis glycosyltransferase
VIVELATLFRRPSRRVESSGPATIPLVRCTAYQGFKAISARLTAGILLFIFSPAILVCAALVKATSPGPGFYSQVRFGLRGRQFRIYKIRTMNYRCEEATGAVWATADDPRVTTVGRVLRRLHLDELPQLWNIFRGDMCFIGPRPERPEIVDKLLTHLPNYNERLAIKPGLTGLSQVLQMADTGLESARTKLWNDIDYIRREGPWIDVRILVGTATVILGVPRPTIARWLYLNSQPAKSKLPPSLSGCIVDDRRDVPRLRDGGILGVS